MIVDDSPHVRQVIRESFAMTETIIECADGAEAVTAYEHSHPDWVIMDIRMEPMDGFEAMKRIFAIAPDARIVMITQLNDSYYRRKALDAGAVDLVPKRDLNLLEEIMGRNA